LTDPVVVLGGLVLLVVYLVGVPALIALALAVTRRRWPYKALLVPVWLCATTSTYIATALCVGSLPGWPVLFFVIITRAFGSSGYLPVEANPAFALWWGVTLAGFFAWCLGVCVSAALSGLRGSIPARLWVMGALLLGLCVGLSASPAIFEASSSAPNAWGLLLWIFPVGIGVAELAMVVQLVLMSLPVREQATSL
jgi:hypothetical protein